MTCDKQRTEILQKRYIKEVVYVDSLDGLNLMALLFGGIARFRAMKRKPKVLLFNGFAMANRKESLDLTLYTLMKLLNLQKSGTRMLKKNAK